MLHIGDIAPDFTLPAAGGQDVSLGELTRNGPALLYFYPSDFTPICTKQVCMIRDLIQKLHDIGIRVAGISAQDVPTHEQFRDRYEVPFDLLSDPGRTVARAYQAANLWGLLPRRVTYLINQDQRIADTALGSFSLDPHRKLIDRVIEQRSQQHDP